MQHTVPEWRFCGCMPEHPVCHYVSGSCCCWLSCSELVPPSSAPPIVSEAERAASGRAHFLTSHFCCVGSHPTLLASFFPPTAGHAHAGGALHPALPAGRRAAARGGGGHARRAGGRPLHATRWVKVALKRLQHVVPDGSVVWWAPSACRMMGAWRVGVGWYGICAMLCLTRPSCTAMPPGAMPQGWATCWGWKPTIWAGVQN